MSFDPYSALDPKPIGVLPTFLDSGTRPALNPNNRVPLRWGLPELSLSVGFLEPKRYP
jgi:hypothetical protein